MSIKRRRTKLRSGGNQAYLNLDKILARADRKLRIDPRTTPYVPMALARLDREIQEDGAIRRCLEKLCSAGCNRQELLWLLATCSEEPTPEPDRLVQLLGLDHRQLRATVKGLREWAHRIERINQAPLAAVLQVAGIREVFDVPPLLRKYAALLEFLADVTWRTYWTVAKKSLIFYVKKRTKHYHDKMVAELLATATTRDNYSENLHRAWRRRNINPALRRLPSPGLRYSAERFLERLFLMCGSHLIIKLSGRA
ncbi:MAG: hypothetical protein WAR21_12380 [Candidatus Acidiferrales bacterium]